MTGRRVLVLLLLACFVGLQTAAAVTTHTHDHGAGGHCCLICHAGHLPALQAPAVIGAEFSVAAEWRSLGDDPVAASGESRSLNFSRAPPA